MDDKGKDTPGQPTSSWTNQVLGMFGLSGSTDEETPGHSKKYVNPIT